MHGFEKRRKTGYCHIPLQKIELRDVIPYLGLGVELGGIISHVLAWLAASLTMLINMILGEILSDPSPSHLRSRGRVWACMLEKRKLKASSEQLRY